MRALVAALLVSSSMVMVDNPSLAQEKPELVYPWPVTQAEQQEFARKQEKIAADFTRLMASNGLVLRPRCHFVTFPEISCTVPLGCTIVGYTFRNECG